MDLNYLSATKQLEAMRAGQVSSKELTLAAIAQIERYDDRINAVCVRDFQHGLEAAQASDEARLRGASGPLLGIPILVKESFNVTELPTTWGIPAFRDFKAKEDAVVVARLRAAGAVLLGKTNVPQALGDLQTYNDIYGTTNNPWNLNRTPGGSSGGSAAALAAGFSALSVGTDLAGSLRAPAAFCGIYAHKPSFGLLPTRGHTFPMSKPIVEDRDISVIGPMARSASDLSLMLDVLSDPDEQALGIAYRLALPAPRHEVLSKYRVLVLEEHPLMPTSASVQSAINRLAERLAKAGCSVHRLSALLPDQADTARLYMRLLCSLIAANWPVESYESTRAFVTKLDAADRSLAAERMRGAVLSHRDWLAADSQRTQLRERWRELFKTFDVVICPAMPTTAFVHDHSPDQMRRRIEVDGSSQDYSDQLAWVGVASLVGLPATSVPIGVSHEGLPVGAQIIGPFLEDRTPIRFAELVEREFGGFTPPPMA